ncbi:hypothetical protein BDZ97DRAFT_1819725 [Flammula alnicola]|nr:hypothetical protein BDZ97DRAFT_1819725 [Flammula alnicola]
MSEESFKIAAHTPLGRYRVVSILSVVFLFIAFLLFLLVSLSLPIIKTIYLLSLRSTAPQPQPLSVATELRFGVWGVCATSNLNPQPQLPDNVSAAVGLSSSIVTVVEEALIVVLVLHPIAAGLALLSLVLSLFLVSHAFSIFVLIVTIVNALVSSTALAIDLALVIVARNELATQQVFHFQVVFGNAIWMILGAVVGTWLAVITISARACYCFGVRR